MSKLAVILAGGQGLRFGGNKPFQPFTSSTLIEQVIDRLKPQVERLAINTGAPDHPLTQRLSDLGLPVLTDDTCAGRGPLSGVLTAMRWAVSNGEAQIITAPCDMPFLPDDYVARLQSVAPEVAGYFCTTREHPLCAIWPVLHFSELERALTGSDRGVPVRRFLDQIGAVKLNGADEPCFLNINSAEDIEGYNRDPESWTAF